MANEGQNRTRAQDEHKKKINKVFNNIKKGKAQAINETRQANSMRTV